jgi:hypothetical protein
MRTGILAGVLALLLVPGAAKAEELASEVRGFAEMTAGAPMPPNADTVLAFERDPGGELVMSAMGLIPAAGGSFTAPSDAVAILRTRSKNSEKWRKPDGEDLRFAVQFTVPVFVLSVKQSEAYWELDARSSPPKFRSFDAGGKPGEWVLLQP